MPIVKAQMELGDLGVKLVDEMRGLAKGRTIEITVVGDTDGEFDGGRMGQLFSNLIGNAIQYSPPASEIFVTVAGHQDQVLISVHNDGDPIPHEKIKTIFELMNRGIDPGPQTEMLTNLGLGLFIAKKIVSAHGGQLTVDSRAELGTVFTALLPRR